ncbi:uncharacterized protein TNIN_425921 [Trichonephila inaurata madagascariensis]|uniref:C2H2-type domain-containing protein n=1 Tax=Trichonephila inaurata madagascariensis TaxID=2747483 RepID=A0A8X6WRK4_9ARAC|nr:uncharacterized protein TNIN_425921 [Trichonephila inaurata madagascariensis]
MDSFKCVECDKIFSTISNLSRHAKLIHNKGSTIKQVRCIICSAELISKKALEDHIDLVHNITIEKDTQTFDSFKDFKLWKETIEKQTSSLYVKNTGCKSGKTGGKITYFYCHRNGFYNARGDKKRNMKIAGSNKINGNCPSKMKVYEDIESKVTVEFTKTHVGHGIDLRRMKITREEKEDIARKLENKIPVEAILDDIRNSMNQKLERIHLITRQDIKNIKEEYNINSDGILNSNDVVSVNKWVEGLKNREDLRITDEEMIICENRKVLEKEAHVDNLRATSIRTEISKEEFQKECMQLINKASPEQYDNVLTLLRNTIDSSHLFPEANQEIVSRTLNMEPPNKKLKTQRYVSTKMKTSQKTSTTLRKPTQKKNVKVYQRVWF